MAIAKVYFEVEGELVPTAYVDVVAEDKSEIENPAEIAEKVRTLLSNPNGGDWSSALSSDPDYSNSIALEGIIKGHQESAYRAISVGDVISVGAKVFDVTSSGVEESPEGIEKVSSIKVKGAKFDTPQIPDHIFNTRGAAANKDNHVPPGR